jgi:hypothetical protein
VTSKTRSGERAVLDKLPAIYRHFSLTKQAIQQLVQIPNIQCAWRAQAKVWARVSNPIAHGFRKHGQLSHEDNTQTTYKICWSNKNIRQASNPSLGRKGWIQGPPPATCRATPDHLCPGGLPLTQWLASRRLHRARLTLTCDVTRHHQNAFSHSHFRRSASHKTRDGVSNATHTIFILNYGANNKV